jgi:primosomal replication protein N
LLRNQIVLDATVEMKQPLRHTPAGVPVFNSQLRHRSKQIQNGLARDVELELGAQAVGQVAERLARLAEGTTIRVTGFLAKRSRKSEWPVLHVNDFKLLDEVNHAR